MSESFQLSHDEMKQLAGLADLHETDGSYELIRQDDGYMRIEYNPEPMGKLHGVVKLRGASIGQMSAGYQQAGAEHEHPELLVWECQVHEHGVKMKIEEPEHIIQRRPMPHRRTGLELVRP